MGQASCAGRKVNIYKFIVIVLYWINEIAVVVSMLAMCMMCVMCTWNISSGQL